MIQTERIFYTFKGAKKAFTNKTRKYAYYFIPYTGEVVKLTRRNIIGMKKKIQNHLHLTLE